MFKCESRVPSPRPEGESPAVHKLTELWVGGRVVPC